MHDLGANLESKGFIGERYDMESGLQFLNARYYDPALGMFIQPDWFEVTIPTVGTNRFAYSSNDPVNLSDPNGNCPWCVAIAIAAVVGAFEAKDQADAVRNGDKTIGEAVVDGAVNVSGLAPLADGELTGEDVGAIIGATPVGRGAKVAKRIKDWWKKKQASNRTQLVNDLIARGIRVTPENVVDIRKINGRTVWLETGGPRAGLQHILDEHGSEFAQRGITEVQIPDVVFTALQKNNVVGYQGRGTGRPVYEFDYGGQTHKLAITVGDNGFIVGANFKK